MQIQLIKNEGSPEILQNLYTFSKEAKIGTWTGEKVMLKVEEYLYILHQLSFDQKASENVKIQWSFQFQNCANVVASNYNLIYMYP